METTTIEISVDNWQWLQAQKQRPSETFDDVVSRLREQYEGEQDTTDNATEQVEVAENSRERTSEGMREKQEQDLKDTAESEDDLEQIQLTSIPDDIDLPGSGDKYERRRQAIGKLYAYLQKEETATRADFLELIDADEVSYADADSFWSNAIKGRNSLSALDGVQSPGEGEHEWRYTTGE